MNESDTHWTPEVIIQAFKEVVTAIMGLVVVIFTLWLAGTALSYAADDTKMSNAKDVLLLVLGLAGVVIGYYFGRVPADARAVQATREAGEANAQAQEVAARAATVADQIDDMLARAGAGGLVARSSGQQEGAVTVDGLRRVRDTLRSLSRP